MKINSKFKYIVIILILLVSLGFSLHALFNLSHLKVVDIKDKAVAYFDGTAEIVINDNFNDDYVTYDAKVVALGNGPYFAPKLTYRGGTGDRVVYTYSQSDYCENNIFYMDRDKKVAKVLKTDYCIGKTLDEHDIEYFFASRSNESEVIIGLYDSGKVFSKITIPYALGRPVGADYVASNWELTKLIIPVGSCDKGSKDMKIFSWDVENGVIEDKTPIDFDCNIKGIRYDRGDDIFYIDRFSSNNEIISTRLE